jgi:hypothetical protein
MYELNREVSLKKNSGCSKRCAMEAWSNCAMCYLLSKQSINKKIGQIKKPRTSRGFHEFAAS